MVMGANPTKKSAYHNRKEYRQKRAESPLFCFITERGKGKLLYYDGNSRSFSDVCYRNFGRKIIYSSAKKITAENVVQELGKALTIHWYNRDEINYLDRYYRGDQPILYRIKNVRKEINNKIVENHAFEIVEFKTAQNFGEPVQYVRRGTNEDTRKSENIVKLNDFMISENKAACDIELGRWRSICGTALRFVYIDTRKEKYDEAPFGIECIDPRDGGVVYSTNDGKKPLFSFLCRKDDKNENVYIVYTETQRFEIKRGKIEDISINGIGYNPLIEYPNNARRLSDIEMVITTLDALNKTQSDRVNGIEQFIQAFLLFKNCEISEEAFLGMMQSGAVVVDDTKDGRTSEVKLLTAELGQDGVQTVKDDMYDSVLTVIGMPSREQNTGGDTGQAVYLRNGWDFAEQRAEINEPIFHKSEYQFLRIILNILSIKNNIDLKISDIEIKVTRSKMDNMSVKANALLLLLNAGIDYQTAIKTVSLWSDPEEVYLKSRDRMAKKLDGDSKSTKTVEVLDE